MGSADTGAREPTRGDVVAVRDASGRWLRKLALSGAEGGSEHDFPIVWVAWEDESGHEATPWPLEDVKPLIEHPEALTRAEYQADG